VGSCKYGNKVLGSIKAGHFLTSCATVTITMKRTSEDSYLEL